ncbi:hypothetical protein HMPREF1623_00459 [Escherichia coli 910096-2]|nr:hypothetical protein HMPREF1623_00459 [Escherichia coli 910096-2]
MAVFLGVFLRRLRFLFRGFLFSFGIFMMLFSRLRFLGRCCFMLFFYDVWFSQALLWWSSQSEQVWSQSLQQRQQKTDP